MAAQDYAGLVQQLYVTYFGRPADYFGLQSFEAQLAALKAPTTLAELNAVVQADTAGTTALSKLVNSFSVSTESTTLYGSDNTQVGVSKFVEAIYLNLLGRAPDVEGWAFWTNAITSGNLTRANAAMAIATGALGNTTTQGLLDAATVTNKITVAGNFTTALDTVAEINGYSGDAAAATARGLLKAVDSTTKPADYQATVESTIGTIVAASIPSTNATLTTGVDNLVGGNGNDVFNAVINNGATTDTLNNLDAIDGGAGTDTLNIVDQKSGAGSTLPSGLVIKNVENLSFRGAGDVTFDQTAAANAGITGVLNIGVTQAVAATITAGSTTAVSVSGATGAVTIDGGTTQTVSSTGAAGITLGGTTGAKGAITVSATAQGAGNIAIDGGTTVSVTTAGVKAGTLDIGTSGTVAKPTGAIVVNSTGAAYDASGQTIGAVTVKGGSSVTVVQTATSSAAAAASTTANVTNVAKEIVQSDVAVTGGSATTSVTVTQSAAVTAKDNVAAIAGKSETHAFTFTDLAKGNTVTISDGTDSLVFTAAKDLTAAQVASAFASLAKGSVQGTAVTGLGTYTGTLSAVYSSGVASSSTVTFTSTTQKNEVTLTATAAKATGATTPTAITAVDVDGSAATAAKTGVAGIIGGKVTIADDGTHHVLATVSVDGYGAGSTITSDGLTTLSLAHSAKDLVIANTAATSLALTVNGLATGATLDLDNAGANATYTSLAVTTATADSKVAVTGANVTALTVAGSNAVDLTGSTLTNLKTVVVSGAAGLTIDASGANVTKVDASATTGDVSAKVDGSKATFTGGAGDDSVTLTSNTVAKAIVLGAGDDIVNLKAGATVFTTGSIAGGDGVDTIAFGAADDADSTSGATQSTTFQTKVTGFEKVQLGDITADTTVNLHNLSDINYAILTGLTAAKTLTLDKFLANGTLEIDGATSAATAVVAKLADSSGTSDVFNVLVKNDAGINAGVVNVTGVETINLTATDSDNSDGNVDTHTIDLQGSAVKSIVITGNNDVVLTAHTAAAAINTTLTSVDASALTGGLTATTNGTAAETIKGGAGANTLTSIGSGNTLIGGAGNDTFVVGDGTTAGDLTTLTGGGGNDTFDVSHATTGSSSYATITDLNAGDIIQFALVGGAASFTSAKVTQGDTAVFQDYANAAIKASTAGTVSWFQFAGNTYVVENIAGGTSFTNGSDLVVKLAGAVDLSHASFSTDAGSLLIVG